MLNLGIDPSTKRNLVIDENNRWVGTLPLKVSDSTVIRPDKPKSNLQPSMQPSDSKPDQPSDSKPNHYESDQSDVAGIEWLKEQLRIERSAREKVEEKLRVERSAREMLEEQLRIERERLEEKKNLQAMKEWGSVVKMLSILCSQWRFLQPLRTEPGNQEKRDSNP